MDYDPSQVTYEQLLDIFWSSHTPTRRAWSRQYMSIIFYHNDGQKKLATESKDREEAKLKTKVFTEIRPATEFYLAEAYHQKYYLRQVPELMKDFNAMYPHIDDFVASTAAARINGYLGGYGTLESLEKELDSFGLSPEASEKLLATVKQRTASRIRNKQILSSYFSQPSTPIH